MTEEEMKQTWCPHVRVIIGPVRRGAHIDQGLVGNAYDENRISKETRCIGSGCSQWRWGEKPRELVSSVAREGWEHIPAEESEDGVESWVEPLSAWKARWQGYCGLAGKP